MDGKLKTTQGHSTTVLFGFLNTLKSVLKEYPANSVTVVWDGGHSDRRQEIHEEYKQRGDKDQETEDFLRRMYNQIEVLDGWLFDNLGITSIQMQGYEGDDLIYLIAKILKNSVIYSGDKDFYQALTDEKIRFLRARSGEDEMYSKPDDDRLPVPAENFIWYLAMLGDDADNIPGIDGVGPKRAQKIIDSFEDFEDFKRKEGFKDEMEYGTKYMRSAVNNIDVIERNMKLIDLSQERYPKGMIKRVLHKLADSGEFNSQKFRDFIQNYEMDQFEENFGTFSRVLRGLEDPLDSIRDDYEPILEGFLK